MTPYLLSNSSRSETISAVKSSRYHPLPERESGAINVVSRGHKTRRSRRNKAALLAQNNRYFENNTGIVIVSIDIIGRFGGQKHRRGHQRKHQSFGLVLKNYIGNRKYVALHHLISEPASCVSGSVLAVKFRNKYASGSGARLPAKSAVMRARIVSSGALPAAQKSRAEAVTRKSSVGATNKIHLFIRRPLRHASAPP